MGILPDVAQLEFNTAALDTSKMTDLGTTYSYDFTKGDFATVDGKLIPVTGNEAIQVWVEKCLRTERFMYDIYARDDKDEYGVTIEGLIGTVLPREFVKAELKREITEALTRHPRISRISNLTITNSGSALEIAFTLILTDGQTISGEVAL